MFVIHLALAHLQPGRAQGGVGIGGVAEQGLKVRVGLGAGVEPANDIGADGEVNIGGVAHPGHRIAGGVDRRAEKIAQIRWPEHWQEEVRSGTDPIASQRIAKAVGVMWDAQFRGDVDGADDADRRVHRQAKHGLESSHWPDLHEIVENHYRLFQIGGDVVNALADKSRRQTVREKSHGADDRAIQPGVDDIVAAVEMLPRIGIGRARQRRRGQGAAGQNAEQDNGQEGSTHAGLL